MKLRIVKKTTKCGEEIYYPEYRRFGFWQRYKYYVSWVGLVDEAFANLERAKDYIELKRREREAELKGRKTDGAVYRATI